MAIGVTNFPTALDDATSLISVRDGAVTTVDAPGIDASVTTIPAPSTSAFSPTGVITIEGEHITYTGKTSTSFTGAGRGAYTALGGSAAAPHSAGVNIEQLVIAATHDIHNQAIIAIETKIGSGADTPTSGDFYKGTGAGTSGWSALTSSEVTTALGFTPANKAGDAFTGAISVATGGAAVAASGSVRLANNQAIAARNAANGADVNLISLDGSDVLQLRGGAATLTAAGLLTGTTLTGSSAVTSGGSISAATFLAAGVNPAAVGGVRLANADYIKARNAANNADINIARAQSGGSVELGPASGILIDGSGVVTLASDLALTEGGTGASTAANARTNLGLVIGANVQAFHANLSAFAGLSLIADRLPYADGTGTLALAPLTSFGRSLMDDADATAGRSTLGIGSIGTQAASAVAITGGSITGITDLAVADGGTGASTAANARTNLGLVIGTNVQAWDADLDTWAGKTAPSGVVVGTTDTQTLSGKTLTAPIINAATLTGNIDFDDGATARFYRPDGTTIGLEIDAEASNTLIKGITGALVIQGPAASDVFIDLPASRNLNIRDGSGVTTVQITQTGIKIGGSSNPEITEVLSASATWDPGSAAIHGSVTTTISVPGASIGDMAMATHTGSVNGSSQRFLVAKVTAADTVTVLLINPNDSTAFDGTTGTLKVLVVKHG